MTVTISPFEHSLREEYTFAYNVDVERVIESEAHG